MSKDTALYFAKKVRYVNELPPNCPSDNHPLNQKVRVLINRNQSNLEVEALFCPKCLTAYMLKSERTQINQPKKEKVYKNMLLSVETILYEIQHGSMFLSKVPLLPSDSSKCPFCQRTKLSKTIGIYCKNYSNTMAPSIKKVHLLRCKHCKSVYASPKIVSGLNRKGIMIKTVDPQNYKHSCSMMQINSEKSPPEFVEDLKALEYENDSVANSNNTSDCKSSDSIYQFSKIPVLTRSKRICPYCLRKLKTKIQVRYPVTSSDGSTNYKEALLWNCPICRLAFADQEQLRLLKKWNAQSKFEEALTSSYGSASSLRNDITINSAKPSFAVLPFDKSDFQTDNLSEGDQIVQVYNHRCHCQRCKNTFKRNTIVNRTAVVNTINGGNTKINVMYCLGCGQYFISLPVLQHYKELYGGLLLECTPSDDMISERLSSLNFAPDTILSRCGYSVKEGISDNYRHTILGYILDSRKAQKYEIIEKINGFIRLRENQPRYYDACQRWREDIKFVSDYRIDQQKTVYGLHFKGQK